MSQIRESGVSLLNSRVLRLFSGRRSSHWTESYRDDFEILQELYKFSLSTVGVQLYLVADWLDLGVSHHVKEQLHVEVGNPKALCQSFLD